MIFHATFLAQGRPLKLEIKEMAKVAEYPATWHPHTSELEASTTALHTKYEKNWTLNDFQPTDPGHSPGAGHSSPHAKP